ncbi:hypothetical protein D3C87_1434820 [compost metagenome]
MSAGLPRLVKALRARVRALCAATSKAFSFASLALNGSAISRASTSRASGPWLADAASFSFNVSTAVWRSARVSRAARSSVTKAPRLFRSASIDRTTLSCGRLARTSASLAPQPNCSLRSMISASQALTSARRSGRSRAWFGCRPHKAPSRAINADSWRMSSSVSIPSKAICARMASSWRVKWVADAALICPMPVSSASLAPGAKSITSPRCASSACS